VRRVREGVVPAVSDELPGDPQEMADRQRKLLARYRVMAFTTAILLIILVFVGIPLQFAAGQPGVANVVGTMHGFLYLVYLYTAFALTRALAVKKGPMLLVLLAGTVPFCAFVAERKMTRRFEAVALGSGLAAAPAQHIPLRLRATSLRARWLTRRALLLHSEVLILAPACLVAGWWQATRALGGNEISWVYSIEWPAFAIIAVAAWWHLLHEDPDAYRARKRRPADERGTPAFAPADSGVEAGVGSGVGSGVRVEDPAAHLAAVLALLVGVEFLLGIIASVFVPFSRPSGSLPTSGTGIYLAHAVFGILPALGAVALVVRVRGTGHTAQMMAWMGLTGVALAGTGGLLTEAQSLTRFLGMAFMFVGGAFAAFSYMIPALLKRSHRTP
jgi:integral membrane protein